MTPEVEISPEAALFELHRRECSASLSMFAREAWPLVEPKTQFRPNWHIDMVAEHLEALARLEIRSLIINMPPRHMKSLMASVFFPAWVWTWAPWLRFLHASYAQELADEHSILTRTVVTSAWYQTRWGDTASLEGGRQRVRAFDNVSRGARFATSVGGTATGKGGDFIIADDPHNVKERESDIKRAEVASWWSTVMSTRGNDPKTDRRLIVMQRSHESDLTGHVLKTELGYEVLTLPARYEGTKVISTLRGRPVLDPRTTAGEPLWAGRFDDPELRRLERDLGPYDAASQLQQRPAPKGGGIFKWAKFRLYGARVRDALLATPGALDSWVQTWDLNVKGVAGQSWIVGQVWARRGADAFLLDSFRDRCSLLAVAEAMVATLQRWPKALPIRVEDKALGPAVIDLLKSRIPGLLPYEPRGDKEVRARAVSPFVEAGNVWLPEPEIAPWLDDFKAEVALFPRSATDDQVDCMSMALDHLFLSGIAADYEPLGFVGSILRRTPEDVFREAEDRRRLRLR